MQAEWQEQRQQIRLNHAEIRQNIDDVMKMIVTLAETADEHRKNIVGMQTQIAGMQNEIVGMQTENRRILDNLLNRE